MIETYLIQIAAVSGSTIIGIAGYMIKNLYSRIERLENGKGITEGQTRQIIADKMDPIKEDLLEIKSKIDYIFNLFYSNKLNKSDKHH